MTHTDFHYHFNVITHDKSFKVSLLVTVYGLVFTAISRENSKILLLHFIAQSVIHIIHTPQTRHMGVLKIICHF